MGGGWGLEMVRVEIDRKTVEKAVGDVLETIGESLLEEAKLETHNSKVVATGLYARSFESRKTGVFSREVGNTAPYARIVEWGARPHRPPYEPILKWVKVKKGEHGEDAERTAWKIVAKIEREGNEPKFVMTKAVVRTVEDYGGAMKQHVYRRGKTIAVWRELMTGRFTGGV
jgi:hypothetical protein